MNVGNYRHHHTSRRFSLLLASRPLIRWTSNGKGLNVIIPLVRYTMSRNWTSWIKVTPSWIALYAYHVTMLSAHFPPTVICSWSNTESLLLMLHVLNIFPELTNLRSSFFFFFKLMGEFVHAYTLNYESTLFFAFSSLELFQSISMQFSSCYFWSVFKPLLQLSILKPLGSTVLGHFAPATPAALSIINIIIPRIMTSLWW